jgi:hypothetical protein
MSSEKHDHSNFKHLINVLKQKKKPNKSQTKKQRENARLMEYFSNKNARRCTMYPLVSESKPVSILDDCEKSPDKIYEEIYTANRWATRTKLNMLEENVLKYDPIKFAQLDLDIDSLLMQNSKNE